MYYAFIILWLFSYSFILFFVIHANCVLCVVPWVGGVDVYTMCAVHRLFCACIVGTPVSVHHAGCLYDD